MRSLLPTLAILAVLFAAGCESDSNGTTSQGSTTGTVTVRVVELGEVTAAGSYTASLGTESAAVTATAPATFTGVDPGTITLTLAGLAAECTLLGDNPRSVTLAADGTAQVVFEVVCGGSIQIGSFSSGAQSGGSPRDAPSVEEITVRLGDPDVFAGIVMDITDVGRVFPVAADANADIIALVELMTDGEITDFPWGYAVPEFGSGSGTINENRLLDYASETDFQGATITSLALRLDQFISEPWSGNGWSIDVDYTVLVFGLPPSSATSLGSFRGNIDGEIPTPSPTEPSATFALGLELDNDSQVVGNIMGEITIEPSDEEQAFLVGINESPDFAALAERLADDAEDCYGFRLELNAGASAYGCVPESEFRLDDALADFTGATITGVRLVVSDFYVEEEQPTKSGQEVTFFLRYELEVIGIPAPVTAP